MISRIRVRRRPSTPARRQIGHSDQVRTAHDRTNGITTGSENKREADAVALATVAVAARLGAAVALLVGPWVDEASDLAGWDVERFLAIARDGGRAWRDSAVEYPPGSVLVFEALDRLSPGGAVGLVTAHRLLVVLALAVDLALAWLLYRRDRRASLTYLLLGLPLVPMGLLRLDLVATLPAVAAVVLVVGSRPPAKPDSSTTRHIAAGTMVAVGALIKLWPALLIPALWSVRRERAAAAGVAAGMLGTLAWLVWAGAGLDPIRQVVELRGATGWQLESVGGALTALADAAGVRRLGPGEGIRLELNAYRIGTLTPWLVTAGRILAVGAIGALVERARRAATRPTLPVIGAVMLGSVAALIVTSPLLSPQFLLWLTPWAALVAADGHAPPWRQISAPVALTAAATTLTGFVLVVFGPPNLAAPLPATLLTVRNGLLVALPISCWRWLDPSDRPSSG